MKDLCRKIYWLISIQLGVDLRRMMYSLMGIPRFLKGWYQFKSTYRGSFTIRPCLYDWYEEGGATKDEYFLQDLSVARKIYQATPLKHVDIGSRIDGFVAHIASFRDIEVFDIRPITSSIPGVIFKQADLMTQSNELIDYCDSISCLHALEHFGLGRYGDPINAYGYESGLSNISKILKKDGFLYLSFPIGKEKVEFNAHRIFNPISFVKLALSNNLSLIEFSWIDSDNNLNQSSNPKQDMEKLSDINYALGIFTFIKK